MPTNFPIIDAHVHLWDPAQFSRPWLAGDALLDQRYDLAAYAIAARDLLVEGIVFVETAVAPEAALAEAQTIAALAAEHTLIQGIVAAAPLEAGDAVRGHLANLAALGPIAKGVRRNLQDESDPAYCLQEPFLQGIRLLADFGFSFDCCIRPQQFPAVTELARRNPDIAFILDHLGKPTIRTRELDPWRAQIDALAARPNVWCKISGLVTEADTQVWQPADLVPYVTHALQAFGPDRVLFGGDWPVVLLAASYARWVATFSSLTHDLPEATQRQLWAENARRCYRLG